MDEITIKIDDKIRNEKLELKTDEMYLFTADYTNGKKARVDQTITDDGFFQFIMSISGAFKMMLDEVETREEKISLINRTNRLLYQAIQEINVIRF